MHSFYTCFICYVNVCVCVHKPQIYVYAHKGYTTQNMLIQRDSNHSILVGKMHFWRLIYERKPFIYDFYLNTFKSQQKKKLALVLFNAFQINCVHFGGCRWENCVKNTNRTTTSTKNERKQHKKILVVGFHYKNESEKNAVFLMLSLTMINFLLDFLLLFFLI